MPPAPRLYRSFLFRVFAAVLTTLVNVQLLADERSTGTPNAQGTASREPITWDHVYGAKRISLGGVSSTRVTWIDDEHYIQRESSGWQNVSARTGESSAWYDREVLSAALQKIEGVSESDARKMADGSWIESLNEKRIVVFRHKDRLIRITLDGAEVAIVSGVPTEIELTTLSPTGSGLAFIRGNEVWVADFQSGQVRQLTFDSGPNIRNGKADWVYFEEVYNRKWQAYRWSPDGQKLAWQQFNDTNVPTFQVSDHTDVIQSFESEHFPKAGETNPIVRLGIISIGGGDAIWVDTSAYPQDDLILTHFNWFPDSSAVYWYAQNRIQSWLDVLKASPTDGSSTVLLRDQTPAWVDNPLDIQFLSDGSFLFFSDRSGWRHLYRFSAVGKQITPVTTGEWEVRELHAVDADETFLIVTGTRDSHIAENIYKVSLKSDGDVVRLSPEDGGHAATVSRHGSYLVDSWSSLTQPGKVVVRDSTGKELRVLNEPAAVPIDKYRLGSVELKEVPMADGSETAAIFVFPPDFDLKQKYPVWLRTYAGPHTPSVRNTWNTRLADHLLANLGIVVITFDTRSSSGYGAKSAWLAYRQLGVEETKDLVSLCEWLEQQGWADPARIGLSGHSYGGYFTSYAMTHCDKLCAGIAGAPVTDWANYDTIYTERFMSTPQDNAEGYRNSSVVAAASKIHGRLLLLHGLKDDNVHPENTIQLVHALQESNKPFELMLYPKARHGIFGSHYNKLMFNFMVEAMGKPEAKRP
jgi:dipeptidyl-peptidase-4